MTVNGSVTMTNVSYVDLRGVQELPRPGGVEVRRLPLGGKNEGSIPVGLGLYLRV